METIRAGESGTGDASGATADRGEIQRAETAYFQALQWVYDAAQAAVADGTRHLV